MPSGSCKCIYYFLSSLAGPMQEDFLSLALSTGQREGRLPNLKGLIHEGNGLTFFSQPATFFTKTTTNFLERTAHLKTPQNDRDTYIKIFMEEREYEVEQLQTQYKMRRDSMRASSNQSNEGEKVQEYLQNQYQLYSSIK